jgi:glycerol uptake facilitator protein
MLGVQTTSFRYFQAPAGPVNEIHSNTGGESSQWKSKAKFIALSGALALGSSAHGSMNCPIQCEEASASAAKEEPSYSMVDKCVAEACGTGIIVLGGCAAVAASVYCGSGLGLGGAAIAWGSSVALAAYTTRDISGAHLNPAVTAAVAATGGCDKSDILPYWLAQMFGATVAGAINFAVFSSAIAAFEAEKAIKRGTAASVASFAGPFGMAPNAAFCTPLGAFVIEVLGTGMLLYLIFSITDPKGTVPDGAGPALVGVTVATIITMIAPLTQAGLNPARDLGPRLVSSYMGWGAVAWTDWWVYTFGPLLGGILGGSLYKVTCAK